MVFKPFIEPWILAMPVRPLVRTGIATCNLNKDIGTRGDMRHFRASAEQPRRRRGMGSYRIGMAAVALFGILAASSCSHSSSNPADKDRPAAPPADAIA